MWDLGRLISDPGYGRWREMVAAIGGCQHPVHLSGASLVVHTGTGEVVGEYTTSEEPGGVLLMACGNRRESVCAPCARIYQADTYQLIKAGLSGGKGLPEEVSGHPRVFVTLTAPSFGAVHTRREVAGRLVACRGYRAGRVCAHGRPLGCGLVHEVGDERLGQPLCGECYDYAGAVLWQAHAGVLWQRFMVALRRELASQAGMAQREYATWARVSFAKVAEYQRRGLVHFHAVIRLDGPDGPHEPPPDGFDAGMLMRAVPAAAARVEVMTPDSEVGRWRLAWGDQLDVRPILLGADLEGVSEEGVAAYIAKYAIKGSDGTAGVDHRIACRRCNGSGRALSVSRARCARCRGTGLKPGLLLDELPVTDHARAMIRMCWELGAREEFAHLRLRLWAHMLGFRGHFSTKSRRYAVTLGELREARARYRRQQARERDGLPALDEDSTVVVGHWRFAGVGYSLGEAIMAEQIRERVETARAIARKKEQRTNPDDADAGAGESAGE
ncbi:replication initiator [Thermocatellispora tengchongensis]|nr:replication initiator [Thermocatellispora tengchongensis]